jgi:hypothetical protein
VSVNLQDRFVRIQDLAYFEDGITECTDNLRYDFETKSGKWPFCYVKWIMQVQNMFYLGFDWYFLLYLLLIFVNNEISE